MSLEQNPIWLLYKLSVVRGDIYFETPRDYSGVSSHQYLVDEKYSCDA